MKERLLFDGAFGTYIAAKLPSLDCPENAVLTHPDVVTAIHREYIAAGADAIQTDTFAANPETVPDPVRLERMITAGIRCAQTAVEGTQTQIFADIGPIGGEQAVQGYLSLVELFLQAGMRRFLFETQNEIEPLQPALEAIRRVQPEAVIAVSFAVGRDGFTKSGLHYLQLLSQADGYGADLVGLNCICGPVHMLNLMRRIPKGRYRLIAMPNAGYPTTVNGRTVYLDNPDYFAQKLLEIHSLPVEAVGGCCGTTPEHIRRFVQLLDGGGRVSRQPVWAQPGPQSRTRAEMGLPKPFVAVELPAPDSPDTGYLLSAAGRAKAAGADYVTIPDSPLGRSRANSMMTASLVQRHVGIEVIPHLSCRDKNQIAIKGELISGNIDGIKAVLAVTGDPVAEADRGYTKNVFSLQSYNLISFLKGLNELLFQDSPYLICAALNINARNFDAELRRAERKIQRGAACLFTQPIFSELHLANYRRARSVLDCRIAASIMPLAGYKNALFLHNEVPGIEIPDEIVQRLKDQDAGRTREICLGYAKGIIDQLEGCDGYDIMTPLKKIDFATALVEYIKEREHENNR